jgi:putative tryptophan/tyrosine transport system substrate-binding protein
VRRRTFIAGLGATSALPFTARAQQMIPVVGFLRGTSGAVSTRFVASFRQGLKEAGFIEGQNVIIEYRYADNQSDRLPLLAAELIRRAPAVIVGNTTAALATKSATTIIPIVFGGGGDPIKDGLVTSLNRPGGNITGVTFLAGQLAAKRLELLRQLVPKAAIVGVLVNTDMAETETERRDVQAAAQTVGQQLIVMDVKVDREIEPAFATLVQRGAGALLVGSGGFLLSNQNAIVALAARYGLPASYSLREFAVAGGLMSYGTSITDAYRQMGVYAGRILKGEKPGDLPVMQSSKFEFVINLKTAKTLGLEFHPQLLATADEVIE